VTPLDPRFKDRGMEPEGRGRKGRKREKWRER